jgi:citrate lyase subunit beta/citryl-CoA lyase
MTARPRRSALYMPASNRRAIEKARTLSCDVVILDLEDSVAPEAKDEARAHAVKAVREGGFGRRELVVRANGGADGWAAADLAALAGTGVAAVLLPKVSAPDDLRRARAALGEGPALWAMIESPRAILDLAAIVDAAPETGLACLVAGGNDLAKDMRCRPDAMRTPLLPALSMIVTAARAVGIAVLDGVCNTIDDERVVEAEARQGLMLGFDGKTLIHPAQIAPANRVFTPTPDEIAWARKVEAAFVAPEHQGRGVIRLDGKMVELLHRDEARAVLAIARACGVA